jgi:hypothetical protein
MKTSVFLKTVSKTVGLLAILLALGLVLSCSDDSGEEPPPPPLIPPELVGSWGFKWQDQSETVNFKINADGTGTYSFNAGGSNPVACTWMVNGDMLMLITATDTERNGAKWTITTDGKLKFSDPIGSKGSRMVSIMPTGGFEKL